RFLLEMNPRKILVFGIALLLMVGLSLNSPPSVHGVGGLASGALVQLDSNSVSQTDTSQQTSLNPATMMFRAGAILQASAPTVGQALVANPLFKFVGPGTATWASPNPVVLDANANNLYDAGEITVG